VGVAVGVAVGVGVTPARAGVAAIQASPRVKDIDARRLDRSMVSLLVCPRVGGRKRRICIEPAMARCTGYLWDPLAVKCNL
jgi:hypothetical protein